MKRIDKKDKLIIAVLLSVVVSGLTVCIAFAWNFYPGKYNECITASGGRGGFNSVQYACRKASNGDGGSGQIACAAWLGPAGNSTSRTITTTQESGNLTAAIYGMCTDYVTDNANGVENLRFDGDYGALSFPDGNAFSRSMDWGTLEPSFIPVNINIDIFKAHATKVVVGDTTRYYLPVKLWRTNAKSKTTDYDNSTIVLVIGEPGPDPIPTPANCGSWGSVIEGTTSTLIKVKNASLFGRSGGAEGDWTDGEDGDEVYATPEDKIGWHACYYPGIQYKALEMVSKVTGYSPWTGYKEVPTDKCEPVHHVEEKHLYQAVNNENNNWHNNFSLGYNFSSGIGIGERSATPILGVVEGGQGPGGGDWNPGDYDGKEAENEMMTVHKDAGKTIEGISTTSKPTVATIYDKTLEPVDVYGGSCYKGVTENGATVDKTRIDGANVYPLCSGGAVFKDANGNDFSADYPGILGKPALTSDSYCWKPVTGKAKSCKDCYGDTECMKALGCNTCNGNSGCTENCCTCNDDFQCLQCTNTYDKTNIKVADLIGTEARDNAIVKIPYNYKLDTGVELDTTYPVYAGETVKVKRFWVDVLTRYNSRTWHDYSTIVPSAKYALSAYVTSDSSGGFSAGNDIPGQFGDLCNEIKNKITDSNEPKQCINIDSYGPGVMNPDGNMDGHRDVKMQDKILGTFDASAGDYVCMVAAIWPTESASGDADMDSGGNNKTRFSTPSCVRIAKRPSFQVWGGDMYSRVPVDNTPGTKRNIYNNYYRGWNNLGDFKKTSSDDGAVRFGSWVEEGLIFGGGLDDGGKTTTIASGAATGYNGKKATADYGNSSTNICPDRAPLSFSCGDDNKEVLSSGIGSLSGISKGLIDYWVNDPDTTGVHGSINLSDGIGRQQESATGAKIKHIKVNGSLNITESMVPEKTTFLVDGDDQEVTIEGDIKYGNSFSSLGQIPKVIIYAKDINIRCDVGEVDAILIATNNVNTCSNPDGDDSSPARAKQLKIVGTVITKKLSLGRTYGAAAWGGGDKPNGQGKAAEIFDYDSTMLMWSEYMSSSAQTDTLQTVYQQELAPRY
ncbi:hypothetical protein IKG24_00085 [Candidatus Saccharibacteria bacterium]|nr:hypothetical protein [Candidatus Saccharibacteria bacterium]